MGWRSKRIPVVSLLVPIQRRVSKTLLTIAERELRSGKYLPPRVREKGDGMAEVVRGEYVVLAARQLGVSELRVLVCVAGDDGPPMSKPVFLTSEQRPIFDAAARRVREIEGDESLRDGRCLELICADFLSGAGWPEKRLVSHEAPSGVARYVSEPDRTE